MEMCDEDKSDDDSQEPSLADKFSKLFDQLEHCSEDEQKQKIEELNRLIEEMNKEEFESIFKTVLFNKMDKMIEENKVTMKNAVLLLKRIGYCQMLKNILLYSFDYSSLNKRMREVIIDENEKNKEEEEERLLVDLCECYLLLSNRFDMKLLSICVPCLLKDAMRKEESEETQKEVEMALLALSKAKYYRMKRELYLNKIKAIIEYHKEHHNLTRLAYQSAWKFFIYRLDTDKSLNEVILNELHFGREAAREMEELTRNVNWKKKEEEMSKEEAKEVLAIRRWIKTLETYFLYCQLRNEEFVGLFSSIVQVSRAARENKREICFWCICSLRSTANNRNVRVEDLLKGGAIDVVLEEFQRQTLSDNIEFSLLVFFINVSNRMEENMDKKMEEMKRKATKRVIYEKMEEKGYEDTIISFHKMFYYLYRKYYCTASLNISDYLVNV